MLYCTCGVCCKLGEIRSKLSMSINLYKLGLLWFISSKSFALIHYLDIDRPHYILECCTLYSCICSSCAMRRIELELDRNHASIELICGCNEGTAL